MQQSKRSRNLTWAWIFCAYYVHNISGPGRPGIHSNFSIGQDNCLDKENINSSRPVRDEVIFQVRNLTKVFDMGEVKVQALRGIDLELYSGELVVLLGPSGSGKSTLLNILGGLDTATKGTVKYHGRDITHATEQQLTEYRRFQIGFVFQFYNLIPSLTALENVSVVTEIAENPMRPEDALSLVGLGERLNHFPAQLSGGEQQRVAIARAIAKKPMVLLCDEPTGALDFTTGIVVLEALDRVNRELGTTTVIITHNADIALMADRVIHLSNGHISEAKKNETKKSPGDLRW
jgi:putative ABC transport system ATP-binding protein